MCVCVREREREREREGDRERKGEREYMRVQPVFERVSECVYVCIFRTETMCV